MARPTRSIGNENVENNIVDLEGSELMERPEDSVEAQIVEVERTGADDLVEAIDGDQLESDVDQLIEHAQNVEEALDDGGMDTRAARATEIAVEDICNRWNFKRSKLGTENFSSSQGRMTATRLGLESIVDSAMQGLREIIEWIKRRISAIKDVMRKYINVGKSIKARVEKLRKRVAKLEGSPDKDEKVDGKKIWQLWLYKSASDVRSVPKFKPADVEKLADVLGECMDASLNEADRQFEAHIEEKEAPEQKGDGLEIKKAALIFEYNGSASKFAKLVPAGVKNIKVYTTFGGIVLQWEQPETKVKCMRYVAAKHEDVDDFEVDPLGTDEMEDLLDTVYVAGAQLENYIKKFSKVERSFDKLKRTLDKATERSGKQASKKDVDTEKLKTGRNAIKVAKASFENAQEVDKLYRGSLTNYATGSMAYVLASFAAYRNND